MKLMPSLRTEGDSDNEEDGDDNGEVICGDGVSNKIIAMAMM